VEIEIALLGRWVRFWHRGELLPLPADLQRSLEEARRQLGEARQQVSNLQRRLEQEEQRRRDLEAMLARLQSGQQGPAGSGAP
jgi:chromosome segregation ATPase